MREAQRGKRFVVIDDFLTGADFAAARAMLDRATFAKVDSVISPGKDGVAFRSRGVQFTDRLGGPGTSGRPKLYEEVARRVHAERGIFGQWGRDWNRMGFAFWRYPAGSRLGWHNDAGSGRRGEFVLFLHDQWRASWGGELLLLDEHPESLAGDTGRGDLLTQMEALLDSCPISPVAVIPKPNRLVLMRTGTIHQIHRVDRTVGESLRCTLTGFASRDPARPASQRDTREKLAAAFGAR